MKLYLGKNKKEAKQIEFQDLLIMKLAEAGIEMDNGSFSGEDHSWVGILKNDQKTNKKDPKQVCINITFSPKNDSIKDVDVYVAPIITIVDEEHTKKII